MNDRKQETLFKTKKALMEESCVLKNKIYRLLLFLIMMCFLLKLQCSLSVPDIIRSDRVCGT